MAWSPSHEPLRFDERFAGPYPGWANGGYVAGTLASLLPAGGERTIEVRIDRPVPLATDLSVSSDTATVSLHGEAGRIAQGRVVDGDPPAVAPVTVDVARAARPVVDAASHPAPGCFVCGPARPGGLDLQPGAVADRAVVATLWDPPSAVADERGVVSPPIVWAALDCPAWYGAAGGRRALLGTMRVHRPRPVRIGEPVVVTGWGTARDGRKQHAGSAIHSVDGEPLAVASSIWLYEEGS